MPNVQDIPDSQANWRTLKLQAQEAALRRGHDMAGFSKVADAHVRARCRRCKAEVDVILKPQPNETQIAGSAVALNCKGA